MATIFETPVALVSLIDSGTCVLKSNVGPFGPTIDRRLSMCDTICVPDHPEVLVVEDASQDARFSQNPYVKSEPNMRSVKKGLDFFACSWVYLNS